MEAISFDGHNSIGSNPRTMPKLLDEKVAIVTGASQGLGLAIATALSIDGAKVLMVARSEGAVEEAAVEVLTAAELRRWEPHWRRAEDLSSQTLGVTQGFPLAGPQSRPTSIRFANG